MKIIARPRQCGKTAELIKMADNHNGYIVVATGDEREHVFRMAQKMGAKIRMPITVYELRGERCLQGFRESPPLFFDNVERCLQYMVGARAIVQAATIDASLVDKSGAPAAPELSGT